MARTSIYLSLAHVLLFAHVALAFRLPIRHTSPPSGSVVVRQNTTQPTEYATITDAVNALPSDNSTQSIFIYPGTYYEQVYINRTGPLTIYGYTKDASTHTRNQVVISAGIPATQAGSNDASGTLRIHKDDFKLYNVDVKNTYGTLGAGTQSQAIAISQYGSRVGFYASGFYGWQDTVLVNAGTVVFLHGYIEGAIDFIFGRKGRAYFGGNTIGLTASGYITASGRQLDDETSYVFDHNTVVLAKGADPAGNYFLGRPWGSYAKVIFKNTFVLAPLNKTVWSIWNQGDERIDNILFAEYHTTGPGVKHASRPSFSTLLNATEAAEYSITSAVGDDYASWVDRAYLV